ncbi:MAG: FMN-binding protein [Candidatus Aminicenantes bacterium]|nr:FMN-binding protein [Candidatus Aminicenantes bacterium]
MSLSTRMVAVLTSVGLLSGGFLAGVGLLTKERIALNKQQEIEEKISAVVPGTYSIEKFYEEKDLTVYGGKDKEGKLIGLAIHASGMGFQDKITFMMGTNTSLTKIFSLAILEQTETPGLGAKVDDKKSFLRFWENKDCSSILTLRKPAASSPEELGTSEINTITGATITSEAILNTANSSLERVRQLIKEGKVSSEGQDAN